MIYLKGKINFFLFFNTYQKHLTNITNLYKIVGNLGGKEMKKSQEIEKKVYELLGVKQFRKAAFKLEKIVHRKDKGTAS